MQAIIQRVNYAEVVVNNLSYARIDQGLLVLLGIHKMDSDKDRDFIIRKLLQLRFFEHNNKFDLDIRTVNGEILVVSQFTLYGNLRKGSKPSFTNAMNPNGAKIVYNEFVEKLTDHYPRTKSGIFQAKMRINLQNNGPVTFILSSDHLHEKPD